jgi:trehalose 6-phosphate phosphatase
VSIRGASIADLPHALADREELDEHAFEALAGSGIGVFVGRADDPEVGGRTTAAHFVLDSPEEVERFLDTLAR